jgi:hypothetical protein
LIADLRPGLGSVGDFVTVPHVFLSVQSMRYLAQPVVYPIGESSSRFMQA